MNINDSLRSLRFILDANDSKMCDICKLGGIDVSPSDMNRYLLSEEQKGYLVCSDKIMSHFLNGLVIFARGKDESRPPAPLDIPVTNNVILKKLRVAFELREEDMLSLIGVTGLQIGKSELSAFLRNKDHRNYRECGDQVLRNLFKGLTEKVKSK